MRLSQQCDEQSELLRCCSFLRRTAEQISLQIESLFEKQKFNVLKNSETTMTSKCEFNETDRSNRNENFGFRKKNGDTANELKNSEFEKKLSGSSNVIVSRAQSPKQKKPVTSFGTLKGWLFIVFLILFLFSALFLFSSFFVLFVFCFENLKIIGKLKHFHVKHKKRKCLICLFNWAMEELNKFIIKTFSAILFSYDVIVVKIWLFK